MSNSAWTVAHQAPQSMEFSRQEYWNGLPSSSPGDLPDLGIEPWSPALQAILYRLSYQRSPTFVQAPRQTQETIHSPSKAHREAKPPSPGCGPISQVSCMRKPSGTIVEGQFPDVALSPHATCFLATIQQAFMLGTKALRLGGNECELTDVWVILSHP